jgi:hypothetical protein
MAVTCVNCKYDLTGSPVRNEGVRICPECGKVNLPDVQTPISPGLRALGWVGGIAVLSVINVPVMWMGWQISRDSNSLLVPAYVGLGLCLLEGLACTALTRRAERPVWSSALVWLGLTALLSFTTAACMIAALLGVMSTIRC